MEIDHIGIATADLEGLIDLYTGLLDGDIAHRESFDGMDIVFIDVGSGYLELLEPQSSGPISRYLDQEGPGIHHIAFQTADITGALARAGKSGVSRIDETPREGAWGDEVAFLHPKSTGGVLIEFVQQ